MTSPSCVEVDPQTGERPLPATLISLDASQSVTGALSIDDACSTIGGVRRYEPEFLAILKLDCRSTFSLNRSPQNRIVSLQDQSILETSSARVCCHKRRAQVRQIQMGGRVTMGARKLGSHSLKRYTCGPSTFHHRAVTDARIRTI